MSEQRPIRINGERGITTDAQATPPPCIKCGAQSWKFAGVTTVCEPAIVHAECEKCGCWANRQEGFKWLNDEVVQPGEWIQYGNKGPGLGDKQ